MLVLVPSYATKPAPNLLKLFMELYIGSGKKITCMVKNDAAKVFPILHFDLLWLLEGPMIDRVETMWGGTKASVRVNFVGDLDVLDILLT